MRRPTAPILVLATLVPLAAGDRAGGPAFTVRDSAGIRIVESHRPGWTEAERWRVGPAPELRIGTVEGEAGYMLDRVVGATRLPDGTIAVADDGHKQLRMYDADGRLLRVLGREGEGPGEFRTLETLARCGADSIFAFDYARDRMTVFSPAGELGRMFTLEGPPPSGTPYEWQCAPDGAMIVAGWPRRDGGAIPIGLHRPDLPIGFATAADGRVTAKLGEVPGDDRFGAPYGSRPARLGRRTKVAIGGGRAYIGTGDVYEIGGYRPDGALELLIRRPEAVLPITEQDLARYREAELAGVEDTDRRRRIERDLLEIAAWTRRRAARSCAFVALSSSFSS